MSRPTALLSRSCARRFMPFALLMAIASCVAVLAGQIAAGEPVGPKSEDRQITRNITRLMTSDHLTRHPLDNEISNRWLTNYLKMLDPRKVFFSQSDIDSFMDYRDQLDDMALRGDTSFAYQVFQKLLERIDG